MSELDALYADNERLRGELKDALARVAELEAALRVYADADNWTTEHRYRSYWGPEFKAAGGQRDGGGIARKALGQVWEVQA